MGFLRLLYTGPPLPILRQPENPWSVIPRNKWSPWLPVSTVKKMHPSFSRSQGTKKAITVNCWTRSLKRIPGSPAIERRNYRITHNMMLDRYKVHFIEIVVDKLIPPMNEDNKAGFARLRDSVNTALYHGRQFICHAGSGNRTWSVISANTWCVLKAACHFPSPLPTVFL